MLRVTVCDGDGMRVCEPSKRGVHRNRIPGRLQDLVRDDQKTCRCSLTVDFLHAVCRCLQEADGD
jgi:hypothetical protein